MINQKIEDLLVEAIRLREEDSRFVESDQLLTEALIKSEEEKYEHGYLHALFNKFKNWKVLGKSVHSKNLISLSKVYLKHALEFAEKSSLPKEEKFHAVYLSGQAEYELGEYSQAIKHYTEALNFYRESPRSQSHLGDVMRHLGSAYLKIDKERGKKMLDASLRLIRKADDDKEIIPVWETANLLALAEYFKDSDKQSAKQFAEEALSISEKNTLVHRKKEIQDFLKSL